MSTRGAVVIRNSDGTYRGIRCQHDSYPDHLGEVLFKFYDTDEKVNALIERGEASSIYESVENSEFYADHGEDLTIDEYSSRADVVSKCDRDILMEYLYLWEDGKWYIYFSSSDPDSPVKYGKPEEYALVREKLLE